MKGKNSCRCSPFSYSASGARLLVATSTSPLSHSRPNRRCRIIASATSVTNSSSSASTWTQTQQSTPQCRDSGSVCQRSRSFRAVLAIQNTQVAAAQLADLPRTSSHALQNARFTSATDPPSTKVAEPAGACSCHVHASLCRSLLIHAPATAGPTLIPEATSSATCLRGSASPDVERNRL
jgi:hypothetical protein